MSKFLSKTQSYVFWRWANSSTGTKTLKKNSICIFVSHVTGHLSHVQCDLVCFNLQNFGIFCNNSVPKFSVRIIRNFSDPSVFSHIKWLVSLQCHPVHPQPGSWLRPPDCIPVGGCAGWAAAGLYSNDIVFLMQAILKCMILRK